MIALVIEARQMQNSVQSQNLHFLRRGCPRRWHSRAAMSAEIANSPGESLAAVRRGRRRK